LLDLKRSGKRWLSWATGGGRLPVPAIREAGYDEPTRSYQPQLGNALRVAVTAAVQKF